MPPRTHNGNRSSRSGGAAEPDLPAGWEPPIPLPPKKLKRRVLETLQVALYWCGGTSLYEALHSESSATILMYHSIAARRESRWVARENRISARVFEQQIRFLTENRHVISMSRLVEQLAEGEPFPAGTVVLTFDDGYADNLHVAAPLLKRYDLPAAFYLPTAFIEQQRNQWVDELNAAFRARSKHRLRLPGRIEHNLDDPANCRQAFLSACAALLQSPADARRLLLADIIRQLRPNVRPPRLTMTWGEVRQLLRASPRFEIGSHSANHVDLDTHADRAGAEIEESVQQIADRLGRPPRHFSFPYNRSNETVRKMVAAAGLTSAVIGDAEQVVVRSGCDRFALPRITAPNSLNRLRLLSSDAYPDLSQTLFGRP